MSTTTKLTTIDIFALAGVTGGCHKGQQQQVTNNIVQAPPPAPVQQVVQAPAPPPPRSPSVAVDVSYG